MSLEHGVARPEEHAALGTLLAESFGFPAEHVGAWFAYAGEGNLRVVREHGEVVAGLVTIPMGQHLAGRAVPMLGLAGVGVRTDQRRRGLAGGMVRQVLGEAREAGFPISTLYASTQPLYRGLGYEQAGSRFLAEVQPLTLRFDERALTARRLGPKDEEAVRALYETTAQNGALQRGSYIWHRAWHDTDAGRSHALGFEGDDGLESYVLYRHTRSAGQVQADLRVTDVAARTARGVRAVWTALADQGTVIGTIRLCSAPTDPFYLAHPHPFVRLRLLDNWMVRVLDVARALEGRGYGEALAGRVGFEVEDPDGWCAGTFTLEVEDGRGRVRPGGEAEVRLHVRGLAGVLTGFLSGQQLALAGLATGEPSALDRLGALLAAPAPWMREMF